ncbi:MAG: 16S rRNA (guanine(527)-N(7))-methyltransferase RsmG [Candidatus Tectomicrobia bacterium]|uniref:Ribosomal RNA small subunit methyltransferase G n=1 Tax=Tectimicrobiota bacterium TaxID=2528274 RepID=A0A937VZ70_UNCTE|nr:16S rRNA (guanine(527)-N(7))-methyltransferase RsmG [Candidatus Tectomicrobia bacterium]
MPPNWHIHLSQQCEQRGLVLTPAQVEALAQYLDLLLRWRPYLNLTGLRDAERMCEVLIVESLDFLHGGFLRPGMRVLDLGTGAGVPGMTLAICCPEVHFTLLDRSEKKVTFLQRVITSLSLQHCQALSQTAEELARHLAPQDLFDVVVSRGVGSMTHLMRLSAALVTPGGHLILRKPLETEELQEAERRGTAEGWGKIETLPLAWPVSSPWGLVVLRRACG